MSLQTRVDSSRAAVDRPGQVFRKQRILTGLGSEQNSSEDSLRARTRTPAGPHHRIRLLPDPPSGATDSGRTEGPGLFEPVAAGILEKLTNSELLIYKQQENRGGRGSK